MPHVRYIDKTRAYYAAQGYEKPYAWARFDEVPFARLRKPLRDCRVTLVSTSDIAVRGEAGSEHDPQAFLVGSVYDVPTATPLERLHSQQEHFDRHATHLDDVNSYFPVTRLQELAAEGVIGEVAPRGFGVYTAYSQRRTLERDGPEVLRRAIEDGVDAAVLTPV